jgi:hypothetical protein
MVFVVLDGARPGMDLIGMSKKEREVHTIS